ncbi:hypothetical protein [Methyloceanibacter sp.]|uniref:hypothetical protein n=1 Tax=Methyloceanibacter sp. TaxID=1965321 RepID=UPI003C72F514
MTTLRECADTAAAALAEKVRASTGNIDAKAIAEVIETVLNEATSEREEGARRRLSTISKHRCRNGSPGCSMLRPP